MNNFTVFLIVLVVITVGWVGFRAFNYRRSRIICAGTPRVVAKLSKQVYGQGKTRPVLHLEVSGYNVSAWQKEGHFWLTAGVEIPGGKHVWLESDRQEFAYRMDLGASKTLSAALPDWGLWDNNGASLREASIKVVANINDRKAILIETKPAEVVVEARA